MSLGDHEPKETPAEKATRLNVPLIHPLPPHKPRDENPIVAVCGECGLEVHKTMMYACPRRLCPVYKKVNV